jgi:hypothetical protein
MNYSEKLQKCLDEEAIIEIITKDSHTTTGKVSDVGVDYVAVVHEREREITETITITEGEHKGKTEKQIRIQVIELETILLLDNISSVSRILRKKFK